MNLDRWTTFSEREQLLFVGSEFERARFWQEKGDEEQVRSALERALSLIDLMLEDNKWREDILKLLLLREEVAKFYIGDKSSNIAVLYQVL